jgi:hypothetical protein
MQILRCDSMVENVKYLRSRLLEPEMSYSLEYTAPNCTPQMNGVAEGHWLQSEGEGFCSTQKLYGDQKVHLVPTRWTLKPSWTVQPSWAVCYHTKDSTQDIHAMENRLLSIGTIDQTVGRLAHVTMTSSKPKLTRRR